MSLVVLLKELEQKNIRLSYRNGKLQTSAPKGAIDAQLAAKIKGAKAELIAFLQRQQGQQSPISRLTDDAPSPLSYAQQRLWFIEQLEGASDRYHINNRLQLTGPLDVTALRNAFNLIVQRHESLRTVFIQNDDGEALQKVMPPEDVRFDIKDLSAQVGQDQQNAVSHHCQAFSSVPFDLTRDQMVKVLLLKLSDTQHVLCITTQHIASDGWSKGIFTQELCKAYDAFLQDQQPALPALNIQYRDFAAWQRSQAGEAQIGSQLSYWKNALAGIPQLHSVPTDYPRPVKQQVQGKIFSKKSPAELNNQLARMAKEANVTLFMLLETAFALFLSHWSNEQDIVIGSPVAGRTEAELEPLIGYFVNTLPLRTQIDEQETFQQLLARCKTQLLKALNQQSVPFEMLVEEINPQRSLSHSPVFQIMFALQNNQKTSQNLSQLSIESLELKDTVTKFDLELNVSQSGHELQFSWIYPTALFTGQTIERMACAFEQLLQQLVSEPQRLVTEYSLLSEQDAQYILDWNRNDQAFDQDTSMAASFMRQAAQTPDAIAVEWQERQVSYATLDAQSTALASALLDNSQGFVVAPGDIIGLSMQRTPSLLAAMLGVLKAGGTFVALDPAYPEERLNQIIDDAQVKCVFIDKHSSDKESAGAPLQAKTLVIDDILSQAGKTTPINTSVTLPKVDAAQTAYVIYTSGSTGKPKGVAISHANLQALLYWSIKEFSAAELSRVLASTSLNFDLSMFELFLPLTQGHTVVLVKDALELLERDLNVSLINTVPSAIKVLLDLNKVPTSAIAVNLAGEPLPATTVNRLLAETQCHKVRNLYGPSEDTTYSTVAAFTAEIKGVTPIGVPVDNTKAWVLNRSAQVLPPGAIGELYLSGAGVTQGYKNRPELTAQRYPTLDLCGTGQQRMYRTGDVVRLNHEGQLEYIGRADDQLKIRGFRIEPGEIEFVLHQMPEISQAVIVPKQGRNELFLAAYLVTEQGSGDDQSKVLEHIKQQLAQQLPDYMVPGRIAILDSLPLTQNGKINKRALPEIDDVQASEIVAPDNATEASILAIWQDLLLGKTSQGEVSQGAASQETSTASAAFGVTQNFFDLGGHSLLATRIVSRMSAELQCPVGVKSLFEYPTVRNLSNHLIAQMEALQTEKLTAPGANTITRVDRLQPLALSFAQQRMWFYDFYDGESAQYNMPLALEIDTLVDPQRAQQALQSIIDRHEILRTVYLESEGVASQEIILKASGFSLDTVDISHLQDPQKAQEITRLMSEEAKRSFDLTQDFMLKGTLLITDSNRSTLLLTLHHIAADGWSLDILRREFIDFYQHGADKELSALPIQYADFAAWQKQQFHNGTLDCQLAYWQENLAELPMLHSLPTDFARPAEQQFSGARLQRSLTQPLSDSLKQLAGKHNISVFMLMHSAFCCLLSKWSANGDVVIGTPVSGRHNAGVEDLMGCFINTLMLRTNVDEISSIDGLIQQSKDTILNAFEHQDVPFEALVDHIKPQRSLSHTPLFQIMLSHVKQGESSLQLDNADITVLGSSSVVAKFDLELSVVETPQGLQLVWIYADSLFTESTIARLNDSLALILTAFAHSTQQRLQDIAWVPEADIQQLRAWDKPAKVIAFKPAHKLIEDSAGSYPQQPAVISTNGQLTYQQLQQQANGIALVLQQQGIEKGDVVAVLLSRSTEMFSTVFAIWKLGAICLPIDNQLPADRIEYMLQNSSAKLAVVATQDASLPVPQLELSSEHLQQQSQTFPSQQCSAEDGAYLIYTSGSTGKPKGVLVPHDALSERLHDWQLAYRLQAKQPHLQMASFGFDVFMGDLIRALGTGGTLVQCNKQTLLEPAALYQLISEHQIAVAEFVPAVVRGLADYCQDNQLTLSSFQYLIVGSDVWTRQDHLKMKTVIGPDTLLVNSYGLTECGIDSCCFIDDGSKPFGDTAPIGEALNGVSLHVLDDQQNKVAIGVVGELYIGGKGLATGYVNLPELNQQKFLTDPFAKDVSARMYRTGDKVRVRPDGQLEFYGRVDTQVKIRGFRIEPGEIESAITQHPDIARAVVMVRQRGNGTQSAVAQLVAFLVPSAAAAKRTQEQQLEQTIKQHLAAQLPEYMVPSGFVTLDAMPLTPNGKVDVKTLAAMDINTSDSSEIVAPRNQTEQTLVSVWQQVLGLDAISVHDNFFALGGDSILSIQVVSLANREGLGISTRLLFEHQSVAELAKHASTATVIEAPQEEISGEFMLLPIQRRFFQLPDAGQHHDNQSVLLTLDRAVEQHELRALCKALMGKHDGLRSVFPQQSSAATASEGNAEVKSITTGQILPLAEVELSQACRLESITGEKVQQQVEALCQQVQSSFDLAAGPLFKMLAMVDTTSEQPTTHLLLCAHHLVVDGVSWRILLQDLQDAAEQLLHMSEKQAADIQLSPKPSSFTAFAAALTDFSQSTNCTEQFPYWQSVTEAKVSSVLDMANSKQPQQVDTSVTHKVSLNAEQTQTLLRDANNAYQTQIQDLLLAGLYMALKDWTQGDSFSIDLEGHGREESLGGVDLSSSLDLSSNFDLSNTTGWFTSLYPHHLYSGEQQLSGVIKDIKQAHRTIPQQGFAYGPLKHLNPDLNLSDSASDVVFNYLGQLDQIINDDTGLAASGFNKGREVSPERLREHALAINSSVSNGELSFRIDYSHAQFSEAQISAFAQQLQQAMTNVINHCGQAANQGYTPCDFPLAKMDMTQLQQLHQRYGDIDAIYPATAMQLGMIYHGMLHEQMYVTQICPVLEGQLNVQAFENAWRQVVAHHPAFRTVFVGEQHTLHQLVVKDAQLPWQFLDWRQKSTDHMGSSVSDDVTQFIKADRQAGIELDVAPLMRVTLIQLADDKYQLIWTHQHVLLDGWSTPYVFRDVLQAYQASCQGQTPTLVEVSNYENYAKWLANQDEAQSKAWWRNALNGVEDTSELGFCITANGQSELTGNDNDHHEIHEALSTEQTQALQVFAKAQNTTVSSLLQLAWAWLLSRYSQKDDIVFGATISGRPADVVDVDSMVGLFINTIPVRLQFSETRVSPLLQKLQQYMQTGMEHGYLPLGQIQKETTVPGSQDLFESLVVFENFPVEAATSAQSDLNDFRIRGGETVEQTNYPVTVGADLGAKLKLKMGFWQSRIDRQMMQQVTHQLLSLLGALPQLDDLNDFPLLDDAESQRLLQLGKGQLHPINRDTLPQSFSRLASEFPERLALRDENNSLTYGQLEDASVALAASLKARGIAPQQRVAVCLERGYRQIVALLAVMRMGAIHVPLDPAAPEKRLALLAQDCEPAAIIVEPQTRTSFASQQPLADYQELFDGAANDSGQTANPVFPAGEDVAYLIYTSGSTGTPKGVMVQHSSLTNLGQSLQNQIFKSEDPANDAGQQWCWALNASTSFDASLKAISQLAHGVSLCIVPEEIRRDIDGLYDFFASNEVDVFDCTPAHIAPMMQREQMPPIRHILVGGEALGKTTWRNICEHTSKPESQLQVWNMYGPTETCVNATWCPIDQTHPQEAIGYALDNVQCRVVDPQNRLVPQGIAGELLISGAGVARGYWNRPEEQAQRFVELDNQRWYRTGDTVRMLDNGALSFVARQDNQVKLQGYRIELDEITAQILAHSQVKEAAVVLQTSGNSKQLVAYGVQASNSDSLSSENLLNALSETLPAHMLPAHVVWLDRLPLNTSGKLNVRALPPISDDAESGSNAETRDNAPANALEQQIHDIWADVLGKNTLSVTSNFFALGGDSILVIAIVARARDLGLDMTAKRLLAHPSIRQLARALQDSEGLSANSDDQTGPQQAQVEGEQNLLPVQREFFGKGHRQQHHFNQSLQINAPEIADEEIKQVVRALVQRHDALRLSFSGSAPGWQSHYQDATDAWLDSITVFETAQDDTEQLARCQHWQRQFDLATGPLFKVLVFKQNQVTKLALMAHHLVIDAVSWRTVLADMNKALDALEQGKPIELGRKSHSYQQWAARLSEHTQDGHFDPQLPFWEQQIQPCDARLDIRQLPEVTRESNAQLKISLDSSETQELLAQTTQGNPCHINELLLTGLLAGVGQWLPTDFVQVDIEGHGREPLFDDVDVSATVGWFTSIYPLGFPLGKQASVTQVLRKVKSTLRQVSDNGLGFGWLLNHNDALAQQRQQHPASILFNYLGQLDAGTQSQSQLSVKMGGVGDELSREFTRDYPLIVNCHIANGQFEMVVDYSPEHFTPQTTEALAAGIRQALLDLVQLAPAQNSACLITEDFPHCQLSDSALQQLLANYPTLDKLYPMTPMQTGMYYQSLLHPEIYQRATDMTLTGDLDVNALHAAWQLVMNRHQVYRTGFTVQDEQPYQVVVRSIETPWQYSDVSGLPQSEIDAHLAQMKSDAAAHLMDLSQPGLSRLQLVKTGEQSHWLLWSYHHLLTDGWSMPVVYKDLMTAYRAFAQHQAPQLGQASSYDNYMSWLSERDEQVDLTYWQQHLSDVEEATPVPVQLLLEDETSPDNKADDKPQSAKAAKESLTFSADLTAQLKQKAGELGVSLNCLTQLAWAYLVHRHTDSDEVIYGVTVSGRPPQVADIEELTGLFINTLPQRVTFADNLQVAELARGLQQNLHESMEHGYIPLAKIQAQSGLGGGNDLFDSIFVFENYPVEQLLADSGKASDLQIRLNDTEEQTNYRLTVTAECNDKLTLQIGYSRADFSQDYISAMLEQMQSVLSHMLSQPQLAKVAMLSDADFTTLAQWNDTTQPYAGVLSLHQRFAQVAQAQPDAIAVSDRFGTYTYGQLQNRAGQIAVELQRRGIQPGQAVGISQYRGADFIASMLAILQTGAFYVPFDPDYPLSRCQYMLEDAGVEVILVAEDTRQTDKFGTIASICIDNLPESSASDYPCVATAPDSLAYIMYTSGSTGQPKGVMVGHQSVLRLVDGTVDYVPHDKPVCMFVSSIAFDATSFEVWTPLMRGGQVVCYTEKEVSLEVLNQNLQSHQVDTMFITSGLYDVWSRSEDMTGIALKTIITGGEIVSPLATEALYQKLSDVTIYNAYGPTEGTIFTTIYPVPRRLNTDLPLPIGGPIANTRLYVCSSNGEIAPLGATGELYIAGDGVAEGYKNKPDLTAQKFVNLDVNGTPQWCYRSGDMVRWMPGGLIQFMGRVDEQVKIRGFRIEPGEVQHQIEQMTDVGQLLVMARKLKGRQQLVAYLVVPEEVNDSEAWLSEVKTITKQQLPVHMVPQHWVCLDSFPLNANGKVERRSLPEPILQDANDIALASNDTEQRLADIWAELLKLEPALMNIDANFFELGGDSIISIQVVSRAATQGLHFTVKELLDAATIRELAKVAKRESSNIAQQDAVTGTQPLLPVHDLFFADETQLHHFNQSVLLKVPADVTLELVQEMVAELLRRHDALRLTFHKDEQQWQATYQDDISALVAQCVSQTHIGGFSKDAIEAQTQRNQTALAPQQGKLLNAQLMVADDDAEKRLHLVIHHLVVDGVSWRILLEDMATLYAQHGQGQPLTLGAKTTSMQQWTEQLSQWQQSDQLQGAQAVWQDAAQHCAQRVIPGSTAIASACEGDMVATGFKLSQSTTERLMTQVNKTFHTQINEVLLSGLWLAVRDSFDAQQLCIDLESHGRDSDWFEGVDLSQTVGWFTTLFPLKLDDFMQQSSPLSSSASDIAATIAAVKDVYRNVPHKGLSYGLWQQHAHRQNQLAPMFGELAFNYLGQFDSVANEDNAFAIAPESTGNEISAERTVWHDLSLVSKSVNGQFTFSLSYHKEKYAKADMQRLMAAFKGALESITEYSSAVDGSHYAVSDFPLCRVDQTTLDEWQHGYDIADLYPATGMQQGLLFHSLLEAGSYATQTVMTMENLQTDTFQQAWREVLLRHDIFRTCFVGIETGNPHQLVNEAITLPWELADLRHLDASQQQVEVEKLRRQEKVKEFDISIAPLMRITLVQVSDNRYVFIWTHHHALLDGWCMSIVFKDVTTIYQALCQDKKWKLPAAPEYRNYIAWLQQQDQNAAEAFWRQQVSQVAAPTPVPLAKPRASVTEKTQSTQGKLLLEEKLFSEQQTQMIVSAARQSQVTVNILVQAAWSLLLSKYSGESKVMFGTTSSGRPADLKDVEHMVGLFINSLPAAVSIEEQQAVSDWLKNLYALQVDRESFNHYPLYKVQQHSGWSTGLFDTLMVFENYPWDEEVKDKAGEAQLKVSDTQSYEGTDYAIGVLSHLGKQLYVKLEGQNSLFSREQIQQLCGHLSNLILNICENLSQPVAAIEMLAPEDHSFLSHKVNALYSDTQSPVAEQQPQVMSDLLKLDADKAHQTAVCNGERSLIWQELLTRSQQLAVYLQENGVKPETRVGVCFRDSIEMVIALLAVTQSGGAFIALNNQLPAQRAQFILEDAEAALLLADSDWATASGVAQLPATTLLDVVPSQEIPSQTPFSTDKVLAAQAQSQNLAYIVYTSGSTGKPKGVMVEHAQIVASTLARKAYYAGRYQSLMSLPDFSFDAGLIGLFGALCAGLTLHLPAANQRLDGQALAERITTDKIDGLVSSAEVYRQLLQQIDVQQMAPHQVSAPVLKTVILGGSALDEELIQQHYHNNFSQNAALYNEYGPSEATVWASVAHIDNQPLHDKPAIGTTPGHTSLHVLDNQQRPVPYGAIGELYIGGVGVSRGYVNLAEQTKNAFVEISLPDACGNQSSSRLYKSGDLVRFGIDGQLRFEGRVDNQIKLRGYRIEPSEIERQLNQHDNVKSSLVTVDEPSQLLAYLQVDEGTEVSQLKEQLLDLHQHLKQHLPTYMLPSAFIPLKHWPLTANGKVDMKALPDDNNALRFAEYLAPQTETEEQLVQVWAELLNIDPQQISTLNNFYEVGGHSLLLLQLANRIKTQFDIEITLETLNNALDIQSQASLVQELISIVQLKRNIEVSEEDTDTVIEI